MSRSLAQPPVLPRNLVSSATGCCSAEEGAQFCQVSHNFTVMLKVRTSIVFWNNIYVIFWLQKSYFDRQLTLSHCLLLRSLKPRNTKASILCHMGRMEMRKEKNINKTCYLVKLIHVDKSRAGTINYYFSKMLFCYCAREWDWIVQNAIS